MAASIKDNQKRGRGRPATGRDKAVTVRLPDALIAGIAKLAKDSRESRSDILRRLIEQALGTQPQGLRGKR
jgi:hypothetical protein